MVLGAEDGDPPGDDVWTRATTETVLRLLDALPHGVEAMSRDIPGLVETSSNVATVGPDPGGPAHRGQQPLVERRRARGVATSRPGHRAARRHRRRGGRGLSRLDARPRLEAPLRRQGGARPGVRQAEPEVAAIHAGLECGIIGKKVPGMDMISFGPIIEFPHSPDERVEIGSVGRFYRLLVETLEALGRGPQGASWASGFGALKAVRRRTRGERSCAMP